MRYFHFLFTLSWAGLSFVFADIAPLKTSFQIRNAAGTSSEDTLYALRRSLSSAAAKRDTVFKNSTSLNTSWDGVTLFSLYVHGDLSSALELSTSNFALVMQVQRRAIALSPLASKLYARLATSKVLQRRNSQLMAISTSAKNFTMRLRQSKQRLAISLRQLSTTWSTT
jgi:hypothetical protein